MKTDLGWRLDPSVTGGERSREHLGTERPDRLAPEALGPEADLEAVVGLRVVAPGDHHSPVAREAVEGVVEHRGRDDSEIEDPEPTGREAQGGGGGERG